MWLKRPGNGLIVIVLAFFLSACSSLPVGEYSLEAYKNATSLKAETIAIVKKSNEKYSRHSEEVDELGTKIDAAYEFSAGNANNQISAEQWNLMRDPNGGLFGGFVEFWKARGSVSIAFREEYIGQISQAYDQIICLEANKKTATACGDI